VIPRVSVIIPHYHDLTRLDLCLGALARQTYPQSDFEIIVADNASPEGEEVVASVVAGRAQLVTVREKGAGPARNGAAKLAVGEVLAFTDCDCVPAADWLAAGLRELDGYDIVGGQVTVMVGDDARMSGAEAFERVFAFDVEDYVAKKGFAVTANLFCRADIFKEVGEFRVGVSEDWEWCLRARKLGFHLGYAPSATVAHPARRNWEELRGKWRRVNAETFQLYQEEGKSHAWWLARTLAMPLSAVVDTPKVLASDQLSSVRQRIAALGILFRLRLWRLGDGIRLLFVRSA
jgi:GT2 family glycosyltransferase